MHVQAHQEPLDQEQVQDVVEHAQVQEPLQSLQQVLQASQTWSKALCKLSCRGLSGSLQDQMAAASSSWFHVPYVLVQPTDLFCSSWSVGGVAMCRVWLCMSIGSLHVCMWLKMVGMCGPRQSLCGSRYIAMIIDKHAQLLDIDVY